MTGIELIAAERARQISVEGYTPEHDDELSDSELGFAACYYAMPCPIRVDGVTVILIQIDERAVKAIIQLPIQDIEQFVTNAEGR